MAEPLLSVCAEHQKAHATLQLLAELTLKHMGSPWRWETGSAVTKDGGGTSPGFTEHDKKQLPTEPALRNYGTLN